MIESTKYEVWKTPIMIYPGDITTVGVKVTSYISPPHQSEYDGQGHSAT